MKVRSGFVSNSSSSSFIVAVPKSKKTKTIVTVSFEVDLESYADRRISTIKELNEYYDYEYGDREFKYDECKEAIRSGKDVLVGSFTDENHEAEETFLCKTGLEGNIPEGSKTKVIHSEGGY